MKTTILSEKTGQMNMGGYYKTKTAQVFTVAWPEINETCKYFRFRFVGDSCDQCFDTIEEAMNLFNKEAKWLN